jgi:hypothetical protein
MVLHLLSASLPMNLSVMIVFVLLAPMSLPLPLSYLEDVTLRRSLSLCHVAAFNRTNILQCNVSSCMCTHVGKIDVV